MVTAAFGAKTHQPAGIVTITSDATYIEPVVTKTDIALLIAFAAYCSINPAALVYAAMFTVLFHVSTRW
jgi:hypothetical protein